MLHSLIEIEAPGRPDAPSGESFPMPVKRLLWEFECHSCQGTFETEVPRGPREEREIRCPACSGQDIKRINVGKLSELHCGG